MKQPFGNGDTKFKISQYDMGGWIRTWLDEGHAKDLPCYLAHALTEWFRRRPHLRMTQVVPIQVDGDTVELLAWYEQISFPDTSHLAAVKKPKA